jgi:hypothetical protein
MNESVGIRFWTSTQTSPPSGAAPALKFSTLQNQYITCLYKIKRNELKSYLSTNGDFAKNRTIGGTRYWIRGLNFSIHLQNSSPSNFCIKTQAIPFQSDCAIRNNPYLKLTIHSLKTSDELTNGKSATLLQVSRRWCTNSCQFSAKYYPYSMQCTSRSLRSCFGARWGHLLAPLKQMFELKT